MKTNWMTSTFPLNQIFSLILSLPLVFFWVSFLLIPFDSFFLALNLFPNLSVSHTQNFSCCDRFSLTFLLLSLVTCLFVVVVIFLSWAVSGLWIFVCIEVCECFMQHRFNLNASSKTKNGCSAIFFSVKNILSGGGDGDGDGECTRDAKEKSVCAFNTTAKEKNEITIKIEQQTWDNHVRFRCDSVVLRAIADPFGTCGDIWAVKETWTEQYSHTHTNRHYTMQLDILCFSFSDFFFSLELQQQKQQQTI